jgi:hypothetical protein
MSVILHFIRLCSLLLLVSSYSKADCLIDEAGLCIPGVTITEETEIDVTEEDLGTEIITTTTTTVTTTTETITNENSGNILDSSLGYVPSNKDSNMNTDWGGQGPASMPTGNACYGLGSDKCAQITGSGNSTSNMGVDGMGTTFINTVDISDLNIQKGGEVRYTIEVDKQDAQDRIYMHVSGFNGTTSVFSGTDILSESGVSTGYQSYNGTFDFSGVLNKIIVEVGGRDINLAVGPVFDDVTVNVFYNVINTIITQHITTLEEIYYLNLFDTVELEFVEEVFEFNDISMDEGFVEFTPIEPEPEEISYESVELEIDFEMNFDMEFAPPPPMDFAPIMDTEIEIPINIETVEAEIQMELEELPPPEMVASVEEVPPPMEPEPEMIEVEDEAPPMEEIKEEPEMVEPEPEEPKEEPSEESQEEPQEPEPEEPQTPQKEEDQEETVEEEKASEPKVSDKEKAATKIVKKIDDKARYDDAAQTKTLIVMQILGNTKTFFDTQSYIQDTNVTEYLNKTIDDQYGMLFNMAQDQTMNDMVNSQWQKSQ